MAEETIGQPKVVEQKIGHPEEVVMEPIHAHVHHAKCPKCKTGNLYHQVGLGMVIVESRRVAPHLCHSCKETTNLPEDSSYPKISSGEYGNYNYINRE